MRVPSPPVTSMLSTIPSMKHYIHTSYCDSNFYMTSNMSLRPFQEILQGNGASPAIWVVISASCIQMLKNTSNRGYFNEPIKNITHHIVGYAFVDDKDLITLDMPEPNKAKWETFQELQESTDQWQGRLRASGGAIVPEKSFLYPIYFHVILQVWLVDDNIKWLK